MYRKRKGGFRSGREQCNLRRAEQRQLRKELCSVCEASWPLTASQPGCLQQASFPLQTHTAGDLGSTLFKFSNLSWASGDPQTPRVTYATITFLEKGLGHFQTLDLRSPRIEMVPLYVGLQYSQQDKFKWLLYLGSQ